MKKISQKLLAFYRLYKLSKEKPEEYLKTWECLGEIHVEEFNHWGFMSYKCPTRLTDLYQENPDLFERVEVKGRSGTKYFAYRIAIGADKSMIKDPTLKEFYLALRQQMRYLQISKSFEEKNI